MARRGGKAANRNARRKQRSGQRAGGQRQPSQPAAQNTAAAPAAQSLDAFEVADAEVRAAAAPPMTATPIRGRSRPADPRVTMGGTSRLTERAVAEYHYVQRDLRNIGVLVVVMALLLGVAAVAVNALGIGRV